MKLAELDINEFVNLLASNEPAPGGGSASALAGCVGISLTAMVTSLTIGREKYKDSEELMNDISVNALKLKQNLLDCIDRDTEAYNGVTAVFAMPKISDEDKLARKNTMQEALKEATKVPFDIMLNVQSALEITQKAVGKSNVNAASDLGVAALNLKSAMQGAWLNVLINLSGINDSIFTEEYKSKGEEILKKAISIADEIYESVLKAI
jgi:methenyltetrahydrofolate cyclohydrolase